MRILITGCSGFIGRNLFQYFRKLPGLEVWGTFHTQFSQLQENVLRVDLTEKGEAERAISRINPDVLIHAAAVSAGARYIKESPQALITDSMIMNTRILEAAYACGVRHVILLSCTVLYPMNFPRPVRESDFDYSSIHSLYFGGAVVKVALEGLAKFYADLGGMNVTVVRHSNIYGPHDKFNSDKSHMFAAKISEVMRAENGSDIVIWGGGQERRDLLHVFDLVEFISLAVHRRTWRYEVFNVGLGKAYSVAEIVEKIVSLSGKDLHTAFDVSKPNLPVSLSLDISKARGLLGWQPKISLEEGINLTIDWYRVNIIGN